MMFSYVNLKEALTSLWYISMITENKNHNNLMTWKENLTAGTSAVGFVIFVRR